MNSDQLFGRFGRELVRAHGSLPFSVQGPECGLAVEGAHTIAWEVLTALQRDHGGTGSEQLGSAYIQIGGGALAAGFAQGMQRALAQNTDVVEPRLVCVQADGCAPLQREERADGARDTSPAAEELKKARLPGSLFPQFECFECF